jgi:putative transcriptional regulator
MENNLLIALRGNKSRAEVAKDLGITPQGLGMIERGVRTPRIKLMAKFALYYDKTVDDLFFYTLGHKTCHGDHPPDMRRTG